MSKQEIENDAQCADPHIVVIGSLDHMTDTKVVIDYEGTSGPDLITVTRTDFDPNSGSIGVALSDGLRAYAFTRAICPTCNNTNTQGDGAPRFTTIEVTNEDGTVTRNKTACATCDGKGTLKVLPNPQSITDPDHIDTVDSLQQGTYGADVPMASMSRAGGMSGALDDWNANITHQTASFVNQKGEFVECGDVVQHFNTDYACEDNNYLGVLVGRTKGSTYTSVQHGPKIQPYLDAARAAGLPHNVYGTNRGRDAILDIGIGDSRNPQEISDNINRLMGRAPDTDGNFPSNPMQDIADSGTGRRGSVINFGLQVKHSFDGAFTVNIIMERLICTNGMVSTSARSMVSISHKGDTMARVDDKKLAAAVMAMFSDTWDEMRMVDKMNDIPILGADVDRVLALLCNQKIAGFRYPGLSNIKQRDGSDYQMSGGKKFRNFLDGMENPNRAWVRVGDDFADKRNTLNHVLNVLTGLETHNPAARDGMGGLIMGSTPKPTTHASKQEGLQAFHRVCRAIQNSAIEDYKNSGSDLSLPDYIAENGIPMLMEVDRAEAATVSGGKTHQFTWAEGSILPTIEVVSADLNRDVLRSRVLTTQYVAVA
tara:strand:+ start:674 stop:2464 length:1791 start_codon:yes stop_codon:yes gene_type:complete